MTQFKVTIHGCFVQVGVDNDYWLHLTETELDALIGQLIDAKLKLEDKP